MSELITGALTQLKVLVGDGYRVGATIDGKATTALIGKATDDLAQGMVELAAAKPGSFHALSSAGEDVRGLAMFERQLADQDDLTVNAEWKPWIGGVIERLESSVDEASRAGATPPLGAVEMTRYINGSARTAEETAATIATARTNEAADLPLVTDELGAGLWDAALGAASVGVEPTLARGLATDALQMARRGWAATTAPADEALGQAWRELPATTATRLRGIAATVSLRPNVDPAAVEAIRARPLGPALQEFGTDITEQAIGGKLRGAVGREPELERMFATLGQPEKHNPLIVGLPGTGKTALIEELAVRMAAGDVPEHLAGRRLVKLNLNDMVAGASGRGVFEDRLKSVVDELLAADGSVIPVVEEAHLLASAGVAEGLPGAIEAITPLLGRGQLRMIGATNLDGVAVLEKHDAFMRGMTTVPVDPPDAAGVTRILRVAAQGMMPPGVTISDASLDAVRTLSDRYLRVDRQQPDAALTLLGEAASLLDSSRTRVPEVIRSLRQSRLDDAAELSIVARGTSPGSSARAGELAQRVESQAAELQEAETAWRHARELAAGRHVDDPDVDADTMRRIFPDLFETELRPEHVERAVSTLANVPVGRVQLSESTRLRGLAANLKTEVLGHDDAMDEIADTIMQSRSGFKDPGLPRFSGIIYGGPGVGKTETGKALARNLFDDEDALVRLDMERLPEGESAADAVAHALRRRPGSVVLVDESEKAPKESFDWLLKATGEGYITDSAGRRVPTTDAVFVLTSNLKSEAELASHFRPELLNRLDSKLAFADLDAAQLEQLARAEVDSIAQRVQAIQGVELLVEPAVIEQLARRAASDGPEGVRHLQRLITRELFAASNPILQSGQAGSRLRISLGAGDQLQATAVGA